jgi:hypothetical protein
VSEAGSYYDREQITYLDGSKIFQTKEDRDNEREVADILARAWDCEIRPFGALAAVDWFAVKRGRTVGVLELKSRSHESSKYPTSFLNVRKWMALTMTSFGLGCPGFFVLRLHDGVFWAPLSQIDATNNRIAGTAHIVKSHNDIEPQIEVPMSLFRRVADG